MNQGSNERGRGRKKELAVVFIEDQGKKRKKIKKRIFTERSIPLEAMAEYSLLACLAGTTGGIAAYVEEYPAISVGGFRSSRFCSWQHAYVANSTGGTTPRRDPLRKMLKKGPLYVNSL